MTFKQTWDNYWYHYKWQTIGAVFAVFLIITIFFSCSHKNEPDLQDTQQVMVAVGEVKIIKKKRKKKEITQKLGNIKDLKCKLYSRHVRQ